MINSMFKSDKKDFPEYLEKAIHWISKGNIEVYMLNHQNEPNANELWLYFQKVINWTKAIFPIYRREMKGLAWGELCNNHKNQKWDSDQLETQIKRLMQDDEVTKKKGIYPYVLTGKQKHLNIRDFTESQKRTLYEQQAGVCPHCKAKFTIEQMEADHITPWHAGGKTNLDNGQLLCRECNRRKSGS